MIAGTDLMRGPGRFKASNQWSKSRFQYGLAGQAILNFTLLSIPLHFVAFGWLVGQFRGWLHGLPSRDLRLLLAPALLNIVFLVLVFDFNNLLAFAVFRIAFPAIILWIGCQRLAPGRIRHEEEVQGPPMAFSKTPVFCPPASTSR